MSFLCHSYVIHTPLYVLVCHPYVTCMYSYVIRMSLVGTPMSPVCQSYVLVCHPYVTRLLYYHEVFKSSNCKKPFLQCACYWYKFLRQTFLFHVITGRHVFCTCVSLPWSSLQPLCWYTFWSKWFEKS